MEQLLSDVRQLFVDIENDKSDVNGDTGVFLKRLLGALNRYHHIRLIDTGTSVQEVLDVLEIVKTHYRQLER